MSFSPYRISTAVRSFRALYTLSQDRVDSFLKAYDIFDHDWAHEDELRRQMGSDYYREVKRKIVDYYSVLNHLCTLGEIEKMYIPPAMDLSRSICENQTLFEQQMARDLELKGGSRALDIGCGRGRIACGMAAYSGASVTGVNLDPGQVASASEYARRQGLSARCRFQVGDMNDLPFPFADASFDATYHVQAFSYARDFERLFCEIFRLLKPGAKFACLDWVTLPDYDPGNPHHLELIRRIKPLIGAIGTPTVEQYVAPMLKAGFEILVSKNASIGGLQAPLIETAERFYSRASKLIELSIKCRVLPRHFKALFHRLTKDGDALIEADRAGLSTTSYYIVARKSERCASPKL
jgi:sterol 24-C-methyltransferase